MKKLREIKNYFETHFVASFTLIIGVAVLVLLLVFQMYLKREYFRYLVNQSYETENAVMDSVQRNVRYSMKEVIAQGSEMATWSELLDATERADVYEDVEEEEKNFITGYLNLKYILSGEDYLNNIAAVAILGENGLICHYDRYNSNNFSIWRDKENAAILQEMSIYLLGVNQSGVFPRYVAFTEPGKYKSNLDSRIFHVAYPLTGGKESLKKVKYALVITYTMDTFTEFINTVEVPKVEYIQGYLADEEGKIIYHKDEANIGKSAEDLLKNADISLITKEVGYFGWTMNIIIDEQEMQHHVNKVYNRGVMFYTLALIVYVLVVMGAMKKMLRPVKQISKALKWAEEGNYHSRIEIEGKNEIWQMAEEYNRMIQAIESKNQEIERQHEEKLLSIERQHQAEREALESQINAHFICNTLGSINYEAIEAGNHQVSILIKKLSNILRYTFDQKCQEVYIYQEIVWVDQYLYLQKTRYENVFDYEISFPDVYNYWPCCKLMFQPFVENSILHGFEGMESGGFIGIRAEAEEERLRISIQDNGCGMDAEKASAIQEILKKHGRVLPENRHKTGIGILNVVTRMSMYYGENLEITMKTAPGEGTCFVFHIPIPEKEKTDKMERERIL